VDDLPETVFSNRILGTLVQQLIFQDGAGGHLGFGTLTQNSRSF